ncbi:hypothetical protein SEA_HOLLIDAY_85 [Gordonia phage Holliday]|nr:hypothetical protein SEA_HOLLIDAY_85 [Gordonia phage Holliday]
MTDDTPEKSAHHGEEGPQHAVGWYRTLEVNYARHYFGFPDEPQMGQVHVAYDGSEWTYMLNTPWWEITAYAPDPRGKYPEMDTPDALRYAADVLEAWNGPHESADPDSLRQHAEALEKDRLFVELSRSIKRGFEMSLSYDDLARDLLNDYSIDLRSTAVADGAEDHQ